MKIKINLTQYLQLGGLIRNLNPSSIEYIGGYATYLNKEVIKIEFRGDKNTDGEELYHLTFKEGNTARFHKTFIQVEVEMYLGDKYIKGI